MYADHGPADSFSRSISFLKMHQGVALMHFLTIFVIYAIFVQVDLMEDLP